MLIFLFFSICKINKKRVNYFEHKNRFEIILDKKEENFIIGPANRLP